jgi:hypothetical protein
MKRYTQRIQRMITRFNREPVLKPKKLVFFFLSGCAVGLVKIVLG